MVGLERELAFFKKNKKSLLSKFRNKYVVIFGEEVIGVYDDKWMAVKDTSEKKNKEIGSFLVQRVTDEEEVAIFRTRVRAKGG